MGGISITFTRLQNGDYQITSAPTGRDEILALPPNAAFCCAPIGTPAPERTNEFKKLEEYAMRQPPYSVKRLEKVVGSRGKEQNFPLQVQVNYFQITEKVTLALVSANFELKDVEFKTTESARKARVYFYGQVSSLSGRVISSFSGNSSTTDSDFAAKPRRLASGFYSRPIFLKAGKYVLDLVARHVTSGNINHVHWGFTVPAFSYLATPATLSKSFPFFVC